MDTIEEAQATKAIYKNSSGVGGELIQGKEGWWGGGEGINGERV